MKKDLELTCILCPRGCTITIPENGALSGALCKRGEKWALQEQTCPLRTLTTSVQVMRGLEPLVSVRTDRAVPLQEIKSILEVLHRLKLEAPVTIGEVVIENPAGTECSIIATRTVDVL